MSERNPYVRLRRLSERMQDIQVQTDALVSRVPHNPDSWGRLWLADVADAKQAYVDGLIEVDDLERHVERLLRHEVRFSLTDDPLDRARAAIDRLGSIRF